MFAHMKQLLLVSAIGVMLTGCAGQFVRRPPVIRVDPANGVTVTTPTVGQIAGDALRSSGPVVYWHTSQGEYEFAPSSYDLEFERLTDGRYRTGITHSIVPNGIIRTITVAPVGHAERINGPSRKSGWRWTTKNHYDGAWRNYVLTVRYVGSEEALDFHYSIGSSPNRSVTTP